MINYLFLSLIKEYEPITLEDIKNSMKEVIQRIILCRLAKDDFLEMHFFVKKSARIPPSSNPV